MNKKKLLALLMALVMTLSLVPVTAFAEAAVSLKSEDFTINKVYFDFDLSSADDDTTLYNLKVTVDKDITNGLTFFISNFMTEVPNVSFTAGESKNLLSGIVSTIIPSNTPCPDGFTKSALIQYMNGSATFTCGVEYDTTAVPAGTTMTVQMVKSTDNGENWTPVGSPVSCVLNPVAKIGDKGYATLAKAFEDAESTDTITLLQDITLSSWTPIGTTDGLSINGGNGSPKDDSTNTFFGGTFDGNGKTISGLTGNLFGAVNGATIKDLTIDSATINGESFLGALAGYAYGSNISNVTLTGALNITGKHFVGGVVGYAASTSMDNVDVDATGTISATDSTGEDGDDVGGVVGYFGPSATLANCDVSSSGQLIISADRQAGGLAGISSAAGAISHCSVSNVTVQCTANGETNSKKATKIAFGGLVSSFNSSCGEISDCDVSNVTLKAATHADTTNARVGIISAGRYNTDKNAENVLPNISATASGNTLEISSASELASFRDEVNRGVDYAGNTVNLKSHITLTDPWTPIGDGGRSHYDTIGNYFAGTFNGGGKTISGLSVDVKRESTDKDGDRASAGLFGAVENGTVTNFTLSAPNVTSDGANTGAAVGLLNGGTVSDVIIINGGSVSSFEAAGGIVGRVINGGSVSHCTNRATVTSTKRVAGGIVGSMYHAEPSALSISNCFNFGAVSATECVGGIVGFSWGNISGNNNRGSVTLNDNGKYAGGIVGEQRHGGTIDGNTNSGTVSGGDGLGGIVGGVDYLAPGDFTAKTVTISGNTADLNSPATILGTTGELPSGVSEPVLYGNNPCTLDNANAAKIGNQGYTSLATAVESAQSGATITLLSNIALTETVNITKDLTIDLNGHNIASTDVRALWVKSGNVIITGTGTISATGDKLPDSNSVIRVGNGNGTDTTVLSKASLTIGNGVIVSSNKCYGVSVFGRNNGGMELTVDGKIEVTGEVGAVANNGSSWNTATTMTINSGAEVSSTNNSAKTYAIYHPGPGTLNVYGKVEGYGGIEAKSGTVNINSGATVTANATAHGHKPNYNGSSTDGYAIAAVSNKDYVGNPTVNINSGNVTGQVIMLVDDNADLNAVVKANDNYDNILSNGFAWEYDDNDKVFVLTEVINENTELTWQWCVINGEWKAAATYKTAAGSYVFKIYNARKTEVGNGVIRYEAKDEWEHPAPVKEVNKVYHVYCNQPAGEIESAYSWGDICTLNAGDPADWFLTVGTTSEIKIASATASYSFAVTDDVTIRYQIVAVDAPQEAIVYPTMKFKGNGEAEFQAKWSIPQGASVQSVTIYRGYTSAYKDISADTLIKKGTRYDANLNVLNGDFLLKLTGLTAGKYQYAVIVIKYKVGSKVETLTSNVLNVHVTD